MREYLGIATNVAVVLGIAFLVLELRQNNASLAASNAWALVQSSNEVWARLAENEDLAALELKVRNGQALDSVEAIRYEALVWLRLEQVWSAYDLCQQGVFSTAECESLAKPTRVRAQVDSVWAAVIAAGPMPTELKAFLLGGE